MKRVVIHYSEQVSLFSQAFVSNFEQVSYRMQKIGKVNTSKSY